MKIKLVLEYFGKPFAGWQEQPGQLTVQGEIQRALLVYAKAAAAKTGSIAPERIPITGSGRTDSGVHAKGQVASFRWPEELPCDPYRLKAALNGILDNNIAVLSCEQVEDGFDARSDAISKCYCYRMILDHPRNGIYIDRGWCIGRRVHIAAMVQAARKFVGKHDFTTFRAGDCDASNAIRTVTTSELSRLSEHELVFTIIGEGFLKQMVRIIVGTIVGVGRGDFAVDDIEKLFLLRDRREAGRTAPASGLMLEWVHYAEKS